MTWRHPGRRARWELAAASLRGFRAALDGLGFTEIQTPKFVSSATESGASVFQVDYFGRPAYLAQSPQFYKQTMVGVFERVYETGPVFRAEPHDTARHLAEYVSLDAEFGFISDHRDPAPRRVRDRAGALDRPAHPGREHPGGHAVPPGSAPPYALGRDCGSRVDAEASGYLVVPPVFKTGERCAAALAGSIPVRLR